MKFFTNAVSALALAASTLVGSAIAENNNNAAAVAANSNNKERTVSADLLRRLLFQLEDIDTIEELKDVCELTDERLDALRELQFWLIEQEFDGLRSTFQTFKEKAVDVMFFIAQKDKDEQELGFTDLGAIVSMSGISGLSFEEILDCVGNSVSLSYDEILYIFCLGDPHFATWQGAHFDYHGQCDLVMIQNENFANGKGLNVHVRLEQLMPEGAYSYVSDAAVKIGDDILEVSNKGVHAFNGAQDEELTTIGGFPLTRSVRKNCVQNAEHGEKALGCNQMLTYDIDFGNDDHLQFKIAKDMVHVEVKGRPYKFEGSVGVMGTYPHKSNGRVARDGQTLMQDVDAFAQHWQVIPSMDGNLFQKAAFPQHPQQCTPPATTHASAGRTLRATAMEEQARSEEAHEACAHLVDNHNMHKNCVFDVMATGDVEISAMVYGRV